MTEITTDTIANFTSPGIYLVNQQGGSELCLTRMGLKTNAATNDAPPAEGDIRRILRPFQRVHEQLGSTSEDHHQSPTTIITEFSEPVHDNEPRPFERISLIYTAVRSRTELHPTPRWHELGAVSLRRLWTWYFVTACEKGLRVGHKLFRDFDET